MKLLQLGVDTLMPQNKQNTFKGIAEYKKQINAYCKKAGNISILVLGMVKAGKSYFIESLKSYSEGQLTNYLTKGEGDSTNTIRLDPIRFGKDGEKISNIEIWDIAGLQETETDSVFTLNKEETNAHIKDVISGNVAAGYCYTTQNLNPDSKVEGSSNPIDCVVYVCQADEVENNLMKKRRGEDAFSDGWKKILELVKEFGFSPLVVMTGCDKISDEAGKDPECILRSYQVDYARQTAAKVFEVSAANVLPVINYTDQIEVEEKLHTPLLAALNKIVLTASNYLERKEEKETQREVA